MEQSNGYEKLVASLSEQVYNLRAQQDGPLLISVNGQWGVGKSRLVHQWASALESGNIPTVLISRDWFIRDLLTRRQELEDFKAGRIGILPEDTRLSDFRSLLHIVKEFAATATAKKLQIELRDLYNVQAGSTDSTETLTLRRSSVVFFETGYTSAGENFELFDLRIYMTDRALDRKERICQRYQQSGRAIPEDFDLLFQRNLLDFVSRLSAASLRADYFIFMDGFRMPELLPNPEPSNCVAFLAYLEDKQLRQDLAEG